MGTRFCKTGFAKFINSPTGQLIRIVAGIALIASGSLFISEVGGILLVVVGLVPLLAGSFDLCIVSAMLGGPLRGEEVRKIVKE